MSVSHMVLRPKPNAGYMDVTVKFRTMEQIFNWSKLLDHGAILLCSLACGKDRAPGGSPMPVPVPPPLVVPP